MIAANVDVVLRTATKRGFLPINTNAQLTCRKILYIFGVFDDS